tara:strand:- start:484 stop:1086 length:603 start_codon:yes stop_codon:yes gene_type:complete
MADRISYKQLLEHSQQVDYLLELPGIDEDEKEELEQIWKSLESRQESKFDAIVNVIKDCDRRIERLETESEEIKNNKLYWKKKRDNVINIIKLAYQRKLIGSKPTGDKYQATIRKTKPKLIDNFEKWSREEKENFGLYKRTIITRVVDESILEQTSEELPDKEQLKKVLENNSKDAPIASQLVQRVSLEYGLRKRINRGV